MKSRILIPAAAAALICLPAQVPAGAQDAPPTVRTVAVTGEAEVTAEPDMVVFRAGIQVRAATMQEVQSDLQRHSRAILSALQEAGIPSRDIQTGWLNLQPEYRRQQDRDPVLIGYQAVQMFTVTVRRLESWETAMGRAIEAGATNVSGAQFAVADPAGLADRARIAAVEEARRKATQMAGVLGERLGRVLTLEEQQSGGPVMMEAAALARSQDAPSTSPGMITFRTSVRAVFELSGGGPGPVGDVVEAARHGQPVYETLYSVLASRMACTVLTRDRS